MKKVVLALAGIAALSLSTASLAGGMGDQVGPAAAAGAYLTAGAGLGKMDVKHSSDFSRDSGIAWIGGLGYQFNSHIAIESGYISMAHVKTYNGITIKPHAFYFAGKGILPLGQDQKFDLFGKAGVAYTAVSASAGGYSISSDKHKLLPLFGIGSDYYLTNNLAITVQGLATLKASNFPATYMGTAGLTYKFAV